MVTGEHCQGCPNQAHGVRLVSTDGLGTSKILLVGDSPWVDEVREGRPFAGAAGSFLDRTIARMGLSRNSFLITNAMWCKPPHLGWTDKPERYHDAALAINQCRPYLDNVIARFQPKVIVTLGNVAMQRVLGLSGLEEKHAYVQDSAYGIPVIATFHPSFIMQGNQKYAAAFGFALRRALEIARGEFVRSPIQYILDDHQQMVEYLEGSVHAHSGASDGGSRFSFGCADPGRIPVLAVDIETPESAHLDEEAYDTESISYQIVRAGCSLCPGTACSFPWTEPFISTFKRALARAGITVFWNQNYDQPRLDAAGATTGQVHDAMWAWHFLQSDLRKGLGFVAPFFSDQPPWKHLSTAQPAFYNAADNDMALRAYLGVRQALIKQDRWLRWLSHCVEALPVMRQMGSQGLRIDLAAQARLKSKLEAEARLEWLELQKQVPRAAKPRKVFKRPPTDLDQADYDRHQVECNCQADQVVLEGRDELLGRNAWLRPARR